MMYQAASNAITRLSRSDGPVCITRLAMRPAKSFWKNVQLCRTTCQWFCQRIMLDMLGLTIWLISVTWPMNTSGRASSTTQAIVTSCGQVSRNRSSGRWVETRPTTRPMNAGIVTSSIAISPPNTNSATTIQRTWRMNCQ